FQLQFFQREAIFPEMADRKQLLFRVAMVEVHDIRRIGFSTIGTGFSFGIMNNSLSFGGAPSLMLFRPAEVFRLMQLIMTADCFCLTCLALRMNCSTATPSEFFERLFFETCSANFHAAILLAFGS